MRHGSATVTRSSTFFLLRLSLKSAHDAPPPCSQGEYFRYFLLHKTSLASIVTKTSLILNHEIFIQKKTQIWLDPCSIYILESDQRTLPYVPLFPSLHEPRTISAQRRSRKDDEASNHRQPNIYPYTNV